MMKESASNKGMNEIQVELKYCERCGGLWLRRCGDRLVYCAGCVLKIAQLPKPTTRLQLVRAPSHSDFDSEGNDLEICDLESCDPESCDLEGFDVEGCGIDISDARVRSGLNAAGGAA
jgi:Zn-finger nucleic acid-binding protein